MKDFFEKLKEKIMWSKNKNIVINTTIAIVFFIIGGLVFNTGVTKEDYDNLQYSCKQYEDRIISLNKVNRNLQEKVDSAKPWFDMKEEEQRKIDEQNKKIAEEKRIAEEKKAEEERIAQEKKAEEERIAKEKQEEEERIAQENAEKNKYNTNISYNDVARNPDSYMFKLGKFSGEVVQVIEGDGNYNLRVAVNGNYNNMLLVEYDPSILDVRILENDQVIIYGTNAGTISYESTLGATITIPSMLADKIEIK